MNADLIKSYLSMVRTYYFEGAYQLNSVRIDGSLITNHITESDSASCYVFMADGTIKYKQYCTTHPRR